MSSATIESPVTSSQLYFDWSEQSDVGTATQDHTRRLSHGGNRSKSISQDRLAAFEVPAQPRIDQQPLIANLAAISHSEPGARASSCLSFTRNARIEKPVRMGAVMLKLLKRYGITDQEIAEGVANYARKHQQSLAG